MGTEVMMVPSLCLQLQVDVDAQDSRAAVSEEITPDLALPGPSTSAVLPSSGLIASDSSTHAAMLVPESMGLPDEEVGL